MKASTARWPASAEAIGELVDELRDGDLFGGRLDHLELKFSQAKRCRFSA